MRAGLDHIIVWHEDSTGRAIYSWSATDLRKPVELRGGRDGGVIPVVRGGRRAEIVRELSPIFPMVASDRRGPDGVPIRDLATRVDGLVASEGLRKEDAFAQAAKEFGWAEETVRSRYWRFKGDGGSSSSAQPDEDEISREEIVRELDNLRQARRRTNTPLVGNAVPLEDIIQVAMTVRDQHGLTLDVSAKVVAYAVDWPVGAIDLVVRGCKEEAARREKPEDQTAVKGTTASTTT